MRLALWKIRMSKTVVKVGTAIIPIARMHRRAVPQVSLVMGNIFNLCLWFGPTVPVGMKPGCKIAQDELKVTVDRLYYSHFAFIRSIVCLKDHWHLGD